jgi:hypothetical protein
MYFGAPMRLSEAFRFKKLSVESKSDEIICLELKLDNVYAFATTELLIV